MLERFNYEQVKDFINSTGCQLLEDTYNNIDENLDIRFVCGHVGDSSFYNFRKRKTLLCEKCAGAVRLGIEDVIDSLKDSPLSYVSGDYLSNESKLTVMDAEGYKYFVSFSGLNVASKKRKKNGLINLAKFDIGNFYTLENINHWIILNDKPYELVSGVFVDAHEKNLKLRCFDCGKTWDINWNNIKNGKGCPFCASSKGETKIFKLLKNWENKGLLSFYHQYTFPDCKYKALLRFDFGIIINDELVLCEFNGKYHYEMCEFFGGEQPFLEMQKKYKIKVDYCRKNGIPLIEIGYWDFKNIEKILEEALNLQGKED